MVSKNASFACVLNCVRVFRNAASIHHLWHLWSLRHHRHPMALYHVSWLRPLPGVLHVRQARPYARFCSHWHTGVDRVSESFPVLHVSWTVVTPIIVKLFFKNTPTHAHTHNRFTAPFLGPRWASAWRNLHMDVYGASAREDNRRQTHWPSGWAPLHPDYSATHLCLSHHFTPDALPATTLPLYPWCPKYAGLHTQWRGLFKNTVVLNITLKKW